MTSAPIVVVMVHAVLRPIGVVAKAAVRPETYPGHLREAVSIAVTAAVWPTGFADRGIREIRELAQAPEPEVATPVLLVHGFAANKSNWMFLQRDLRAAGYGRVHALNYNPFRQGVPEIAAACVERAHQLMDATGTDRVHLVGHSLGGIVIRYAVQLGGLEAAASCITVASPHQGVALARFAPGNGTAAQLGPDSDVLRRLRASSRRLPTRFVAYYSNLDLLVPGHRAMIGEPVTRARNILVKDEGHLSILLSRRLSASLLQQLDEAEGRPSATRVHAQAA